MTWKYRYRRDFIPDDELIERCNALGQEGWSIVGPPRWVPPEQPYESVGLWACFFKRTISNREQAYEAMHRKLTPEEEAQIAAFIAREPRKTLE